MHAFGRSRKEINSATKNVESYYTTHRLVPTFEVLYCLVDFDVPLLGLLQALEPSIEVKSLLLGNSLEHVLDARHHTLKTTEVDVGSVLELGKNLISVFLNLVLDVHLSSLGVGLFTGESVVKTEVFRVRFLGSLELVIVKKGIRVGNSEEQPSFSLVGTGGRGVLSEETTDESTVRSNSGSGGNHDQISLGVFLGHEHNLSSRSGHLDIITGLSVAQEVRADSLLGGIIGLELGAPVSGTTNAERSGLSGHVVSVTRGGDGVKTNGVGLSVLLSVSRGDDTPGLTFPVREISIVIDDDVAGLSSGLGSDNALGGDNLSGEGSLVLVDVHRNSGLVIVRLGLKEILGGNLSATVREK